MQKPKNHPKKSRTRLTPEQQAARDTKTIADFDAEFPIGSTVWYWSVLAPGEPVRETKIRRGCFIAASGHPVCFLEGVSGYVSIYHVKAVDESRRPHLKFVA